jgi:glycosidase
MQWDATAQGGFTSGTPWLPPADPAQHNVADQERDPAALLHLYRDLIAARRTMTGRFELLAGTPPGVVAFRRGDHLVALNLGDGPADAPAAGVVLRHTHDPARRTAPARLAPGEGFLARIPA